MQHRTGLGAVTAAPLAPLNRRQLHAAAGGLNAVLALLLARRLVQRVGLRPGVARVTLALAVHRLVKDCVKRMVRRTRPGTRETGSGGSSFPSGHASLGALLATLLGGHAAAAAAAGVGVRCASSRASITSPTSSPAGRSARCSAAAARLAGSSRGEDAGTSRWASAVVPSRSSNVVECPLLDEALIGRYDDRSAAAPVMVDDVAQADHEDLLRQLRAQMLVRDASELLLLSEGALTEEQLTARLRCLDLPLDELRSNWFECLTNELYFLPLPGDRMVHVATVLDGAVLTCRPSERELALGVLLSVPDLDVFEYLRRDDVTVPLTVPLARGGALRMTNLPSSALGLEHPDRRTVWAGPQGWLDGIAPGDLIALFFQSGEAHLVRDAKPVAEPKAVAAALRASYEVTMQMGRSLPEVGDVVLRSRALTPGLLDRPGPPIGDLLDLAGLERHFETLAPVGTGFPTHITLGDVY